jgi:hypothetical protein
MTQAFNQHEYFEHSGVQQNDIKNNDAQYISIMAFSETSVKLQLKKEFKILLQNC